MVGPTVTTLSSTGTLSSLSPISPPVSSSATSLFCSSFSCYSQLVTDLLPVGTLVLDSRYLVQSYIDTNRYQIYIIFLVHSFRPPLTV